MCRPRCYGSSAAVADIVARDDHIQKAIIIKVINDAPLAIETTSIPALLATSVNIPAFSFDANALGGMRYFSGTPAGYFPIVIYVRFKPFWSGHRQASGRDSLGNVPRLSRNPATLSYFIPGTRRGDGLSAGGGKRDCPSQICDACDAEHRVQLSDSCGHRGHSDFVRRLPFRHRFVHFALVRFDLGQCIARLDQIDRIVWVEPAGSGECTLVLMRSSRRDSDFWRISQIALKFCSQPAGFGYF